MRTKKAVSAIAYHRPEVFGRLTDDLRKAGAIGPCLWIAHQGEGGDKPHIHLVLLDGFKVYETDTLSSLWGIDIIDGQPATVSKRWQVTKRLSDWVLYGIHDAQYLAFKGLEREHAYTWTDIHASKGDEGVLAEVIDEAKDALGQMGDKTTKRLLMLARAGKEWREVVLSGLVPMGQYSQAARAWQVIRGVIHEEECRLNTPGWEVNESTY